MLGAARLRFFAAGLVVVACAWPLVPSVRATPGTEVGALRTPGEVVVTRTIYRRGETGSTFVSQEVYVARSGRGGSVRKVTRDFGGWSSFSPSGDRVVYQSRDARDALVRIVDRDGRNATTVWPGAVMPAWSPINYELAGVTSFSGPAVVSLRDLRTGETTLISPIGERVSHLAPAWSPDGVHVAFFSRSFDDADWRIITIVRTPGYSPVPPRRLEVGGALNPRALAWSPEGDLIAFARVTGTYLDEIWTVRPDGSELHRVTDQADASSGRLAFSPDGRLILFSGRNPDGGVDLQVVPADGRSAPRPLRIPRPRSPFVAGDEPGSWAPGPVPVMSPRRVRKRLTIRGSGWATSSGCNAYVDLAAVYAGRTRTLARVRLRGASFRFARSTASARRAREVIATQRCRGGQHGRTPYRLRETRRVTRG
jgi:dipeptidyl aminopeptidase/acylaminoacyl peptidase